METPDSEGGAGAGVTAAEPPPPLLPPSSLPNEELVRLSSFLTPEEEARVPDTLRSKLLSVFADLTRNFHNAVNQKQRDRVSYGEHEH